MNTQKFSDAQYMSGADKALVLRQWKSFLKALANADLGQLEGADYGYYPRSLEHVFTDRLYKFLSCYSGFIAHYNRRGFLSARFTTQEEILSSFETLRTRTYNGGYSDYADLGRALAQELDTLQVTKAFALRWARESANAEELERAELARLRAKYPETPKVTPIPAAPIKDNSFTLILPIGAAAPEKVYARAVKKLRAAVPKASAPTVKKWNGTAPTHCDLCNNPLSKVFFDAKTVHGPWGILCMPCNAMSGAGIGQKYDLKTLVKLGDL
jgi:hypothetical protein